MYDESVKNPNKFWSGQAKEFLTWIKMFDEVDGCRIDEGLFSWFAGGHLNVTGKKSSRLHQLGYIKVILVNFLISKLP